MLLCSVDGEVCVEQGGRGGRGGKDRVKEEGGGRGGR